MNTDAMPGDIRPRRAPGVAAHDRPDREGAQLTILKHPEGHYFELSAVGRWIWDRLDGEHSARDLTVALFEAHGRFYGPTVLGLIAELGEHGFIEPLSLPAELPAPRRPLRQRITDALTWRWTLRKGVNAFFDRLHRAVGRWLFSKPVLILLAALCVTGLALLVAHLPDAVACLAQMSAATWATLFPMGLAALVLHELAHGMTTRALGREVLGVGVGWLWLGPIAFVDTSDMWLASRRDRILVSLAGPAMNLLLGALSAWAAVALEGSPRLVALCWLFSLNNVIGALANLNPALEYDGYYALMDGLDVRNLRPRAMQWLRSGGLRRALRDPAERAAHRVELLYGAMSVGTIAAAAVATVLFGRLVLEARLSLVIDAAWASAASWGLALTVATLAGAGLVAELTGAGKKSHSEASQII